MQSDFGAHLQSALGTAYTIERELGGGGMSRVFVAHEPALGRTVVLKVLPRELAEGLSADRFTREVRLVARLQHPNIVPLLTAGTAGGLPYYTMPFVRGESLRHRLAQGGALPVADVVSLLRDVARALAYAHGEGVVHRDIKPDNVLLSGPVALVADFGIGKALTAASGSHRPEAPEAGARSAGAESAREPSTSSMTLRGMALGTPAYMAPEQALADPAADHRVDLYALGVLAWETLTGRLPFGDRTGQAVIAAHVAETPPDVVTHRADVPAALGSLVMRLLAKRPDDRPATAAEVLRLLDTIGSSPESSSPQARPGAASPARSRWRAPIALALLAGALGAGAAWWRGRAAPVDPSLNVVAIAPFRVSGADPSLHYLRDGMVDLLAAKVAGIGGLRAIDPRTTLGAWHRAARGDGDLVDEDALRVAHAIGAGRLILGELAGTSANLTLTATLVPAQPGREPATATGPADSLPALVDRLAAQLGSLGAGESAPRLAALTSTSLPALRAYLDGRSLYRAGNASAAMQSYFRAVELDSSFTLAALGLVRTAGWGGQTAADQARAIAVGGHILARGRARLSRPDAALAEATLGPRYPAPKTYSEWFDAAERLTSLAPDNAEGWFDLGDALYHGGGILGIADADERALRAFSRAIALDSAFTPSYIHLSGLYSEAGDSAHYRQLFAIGQRRIPALAQGFYGLQLALLEADSVRARAFRAEMPRLPRPVLAGIVPGTLYNHRGLDVAQRALDLLAPQTITSEERLQLAHLAFACPDRARTSSRSCCGFGRHARDSRGRARGRARIGFRRR